jgi:hypothetical protein
VSTITPRRSSSRRRWLAPAAVATAALVALGISRGSLWPGRSPALEPQRVAAAPFENRTGRRDLDDLGAMAADWMIRGLLETPMLDPADLQAVYTGEGTGGGPGSDPVAAARRNGASRLIRGSYYGSGDSVLFQARIEDVASGRVLTSFEPIGAPVAQATKALEALRERVTGGLSPLVNALNRGYPIDPDLALPRSLAAYREFIAGVNLWRIGDWDDEAEHYRRAARLDSTFIAPLIQLAYRSLWNNQCSVTDSVGRVLEPRREQLSQWNRMTMDLLRARCEGRMVSAVDLMTQRHTAYPKSASARAQYAQALQFSNQPRAARAVLRAMNPERDMGWWNSPASVWPRYWSRLAATWHMLGGYREELDITDRWEDSTDHDWQIVRGRALAALGREPEVLALVNSMARRSVDSVAPAELTIADELAAHGHSAEARVVAESMLVRFKLAPDTAWSRAANAARANRLLGRAAEERLALERVTQSEADTLTKLEATGRIAVLLGDTASANRIDRILATQSNQPLENPQIRAEQILARAHLAAGLGRRNQAVDLLRDAAARGLVHLGASHAFHADPLLAGLRGYPPFEALLVPDN